MRRIGVDVGGTKTEVVVFQLNPDGSYQVEVRERIQTHRLEGYEHVIRDIGEFLVRIISLFDARDFPGIGIGLPGAVDPKTNRMLNGNSKIFIGKDIAKDLSSIVQRDLPIRLANDANCFIKAEHTLGRGKEFYSLRGIKREEAVIIGLILGTGVGGGCVSQGQLITGARGGAFELGHTELFAHGRSCYCGRYGCVEQYLSGPGLEASYAKRMYSHIHQRPSAQEIFKLYQQGDPLALAVVNEYKDNLAKFVANISQMVDPHLVVLGGGVSEQEILYEGLDQRVQRQTFLHGEYPIVRKNMLGDSSGVFGAALLFD